MTSVTLRTSQVERSWSASDGHRILVNVIAAQPLKGFEPTLT